MTPSVGIFYGSTIAHELGNQSVKEKTAFKQLLEKQGAKIAFSISKAVNIFFININTIWI